MQPELSAQRDQAARIEKLLQVVSAFPDQDARATTEELIQTVLDMYGQGLTRILELTVQATTAGQELIDTLARDELVGSLLLLHGLHPLPIEERITRTLDELQPYLNKHGGKAELLRVEQGVAYLALESSGKSCSSTLHLLKTKLEETLYEAVPDLEDLRVESATEPAARPQRVTFVPRRTRQGRPAEVPVGPAAPEHSTCRG